MGELGYSSNRKNIIDLARNTPVALVVGAAGFLGSNLVDKLLSKGIQVIGVDNFKQGKRENLEEATKNKNFHLIETDAQDLELEVDRLNYLFIATEDGWNLTNILEIFKKTGCKCLLVSAIELYNEENESGLNWLKVAESKLAKFAQENNLNARVLRLGAVFGPRMHFRYKDPLIKLIQTSLSGDLQKETALEFSSRALYAEDAVDLIIKSMLAGATALKIFDGVLPTPLKVSEIKQILLDPIWYENRGFNPSELPPWPTPNLAKTQKLLNWQPKSNIIRALKDTLAYFKDHEIRVPKVEVGKREVGEQDGKLDEEKKLELEKFKKEGGEVKKTNRGVKFPKFSLPVSKIYLFLAVSLITYALIWPVVKLGWGVLTFRHQVSEVARSLEKGEFEKSLNSLEQAKTGIGEAKIIFESLEPLRKVGFLKNQFASADKLEELVSYFLISAQNATLGVESLYQGLKAVSGEIVDSPADYFSSAQVNLALADQNLARMEAIFADEEFLKSQPVFLRPGLESLKDRLLTFSKLVSKGRAFSLLLPQVVALEGSKNYLILLQNNMELRPAGGFIGSFATINFENGKLKRLNVDDVYTLDKQLKIHVEPPKELMSDLGQPNWYLRDSNWEADFPSAAKQAEWFYNQEGGGRVEGVVALDISAIEELLKVVGGVDLKEYGKITGDNLFSKAISYPESSFFATLSDKKSFLTALSLELFNKIFFLPKQNWPGIAQALGKSMEGKHLSIFLDDPKLFSYLISQNWTAALPRPSYDKEGPLLDFLFPVEANLGANKVNYYLERSYSLETVIGKEGQIKHRLRITYTNKSPSEAFPGGVYKNRMRFYLPLGAKLDKIMWGEGSVIRDVSSFVDFGRTGYSLLLQLAPKEQKVLLVDYDIPAKLEFKDGIAEYRLDVIKQAGILKDPFTWRVSYPLDYQLISTKDQKLAPQEFTINTDLSTDRSFGLTFKK